MNIAVRLLSDAYDDRFDVAIIMSGDSDPVPIVEAVRERFADKSVIVAFPPKRRSNDLAESAHAGFQISRAAVRSNRLPDPVVTQDGAELRAPFGWLPIPPVQGKWQHSHQQRNVQRSLVRGRSLFSASSLTGALLDLLRPCGQPSAWSVAQCARTGLPRGEHREVPSDHAVVTTPDDPYRNNLPQYTYWLAILVQISNSRSRIGNNRQRQATCKFLE